MGTFVCEHGTLTEGEGLHIKVAYFVKKGK
jgi:hypothetical protein